MIFETRHFEERLVRLDEMRNETLEKRLNLSESQTEKSEIFKQLFTAGDFVKLRKFAQDNQKSHKLESRWEGFYRVISVSANGKRLWLEDLYLLAFLLFGALSVF